jgi:hypothetical protein
VLPGDVFVRQRLVLHHRAALARETGVPAWERRTIALHAVPTRRRGRRLRLLFRPRPVHGAT